jgi:hypothetical protein
MTIARRRRNFCNRIRTLLAAIAVAAGPTPALRAATTEQIVVDPQSGLAISGFDAVAYFTDSTALLGTAQFEHSFAGAVWRFRNEGNRAAFMADPEIYMPQFGGYDPTAIARKVAVPGDPRLWLMARGRLYFFHTPEARQIFAAASERIAPSAEQAWSAVQSTLSP